MNLTIDPRIFDTFPGVKVGVVVCEGIDNTGEPELAGEWLRAAEAGVAGRVEGPPLAEHLAIAPWRAAYRSFGVTPKKARSSIEALSRRALKGNTLPRINPLVDLYNAISLEFLLPVGGEDLTTMDGDLQLTFAGPEETTVDCLGTPEPQAPAAGEVIYRDDVGAVCRRWNWREARRTCLTPETTRAVLVLDALPPLAETAVGLATETLAKRVVEICGGQVRKAVLGADKSTFPLSEATS